MRLLVALSVLAVMLGGRIVEADDAFADVDVPPLPPAASKPPCAVRAAEFRDAVVLIEVGTGLGSGFFYQSTNTIVTAFHVVASGWPILITTRDGRYSRVRAHVHRFDRKHDLAVLRLSTPAEAVPVLRTGPEQILVGSEAVAIGHPFGHDSLVDKGAFEGLLRWSTSTGHVSNVSDHWVQFDGGIAPGSSGGPLITCDGQVLGVASSGAGGVSTLGSFARLAGAAQLFEGPPQRFPWGLEVEVVQAQGYSLHEGAAIQGGLALRLRDRLVIESLGRFTGKLLTDSLSDRDVRFHTELTLAWEQLIPLRKNPFRVGLLAGGALEWQRQTRTAVADLLMPCAQAPCPAVVQTSTLRLFGALATAAFVRTGPVELRGGLDWFPALDEVVATVTLGFRFRVFSNGDPRVR